MPSPFYERMHRAELRQLVIALGIALASGLAIACESEERSIEVKPITLALGEYYGLSWGGTQVERFHVLAHSGTKDGDVVLVSPQHDLPCSLGQLDGYTPVQPDNGGDYVIGSPSPARIGIFDRADAEGRGRIGFSDIECKRTPLEVLGVSPSSVRSLVSRDLSQITLAVPMPDNTLDYVQPWADKQEIVAQDVTSIRTQRDGVWLVEHKQAVRRDHEGRELARYGHGVKEILPIGRELDVALVDDDGLSLREKGETTKIERDACRVRSLASFLPNALGYASPCDGNRLVVRDADGKTFAYEQDIEALFVFPGRLLFTVSTETTTQLWDVRSNKPETPKLLMSVPRFDIGGLWTMSQQRLLLTTQEDDDTLSLRVAQTVGDITTLELVDEQIVGFSMYERGIAIAKSDDTLTLLDRNSLAPMLHEQGVRKSGFRFLFGDRSAALAYIKDVDAETGLGVLELHFLTGEHFSIDTHVRELREVWWPERGILYAKGGTHAALRFARVDLPCQKTSGSPWACGF